MGFRQTISKFLSDLKQCFISENNPNYKYDSKVTQKIELLKEKAQEGNINCQYQLGCLYEFGESIPRDMGLAILWFTAAANQGYLKAQIALGFIYLEGKKVTQDYTKAIKWLSKAAKQGDTDIQYTLGSMYLGLNDIPKDLEKAEMWLNKAAEQGNAQAQSDLGCIYSLGLHDLPRDEPKAIDLLSKAAIQGNTLAQAHLTSMYNNYDFPSEEKRFQSTHERYKQEAKQGLAIAKNILDGKTILKELQTEEAQALAQQKWDELKQHTQ